MHAGRQDVAILKRSWSTEITNVFDTQVAAGFLGHGNQEGYESLVRKVLKVQLKGSEGFTRWDRRPLTPQQLEYAADDARLLLSLGRCSSSAGSSSGAASSGRARSAVHSRRSRTSATPERLYERLPRLGRLNDRARAVARELVEWREHAARSADRPASTVLPDQALIELARRAPEESRRARADPRAAPADASPSRRRPARGDRPRGRPQRAAGAARAAPARLGRRPARLARAGTRAPSLDGVGRGRGADRDPVRAGQPRLCAAARPRRRTRPGWCTAGGGSWWARSWRSWWPAG